MKKILLASVALFGLTAGAMAADLPARRAAPVFTPVPVFTWTGFYVGVNAGYGFSTRDDRSTSYSFGPGFFGTGTVANTITLNDDRSEDGFVGGGQIGFNYQVGTFVWGVEADAQYADLGRGRGGFSQTPTVTVGGVGVPGTVVTSVGNMDFFGTVRGRLGVAIDRTLIYATGGFAYANNGDCDSGFASRFNCDDDFRFGWTVGGGLEYAFTNNFTAKIEGLYVNLDSRRGTGGTVYDSVTNTLYIDDRRNSDFAVIRAGLNYKF